MIGLNFDERARQQFALSLNRYVQGTLAEGSRLTHEAGLEPGSALAGEPAVAELDPAARRELRARMEREPMHQYWLAMMQTWQDLLWTYVGECVDRQLDALVDRCRPRPGDLGTLTLDPELEPPAYQRAVDNHSLPGGYHAETRADDVRQGAIYAQSANVYLLGQTGARHDYRGQTLIAHVLGRRPDLAPLRILDLGCLVGASTLAYCEQFPDAELHAVDTSAPALRYAHGLAEAAGHAVHYAQQDAEKLRYPDGHFDLVVSHVLFHETSKTAVGRILAECHRVLKPGGMTAHIEIPARVEVMKPWDWLRSSYEGLYNQEPFWNGLTGMDLAACARAAGFSDAVQGFQTTTPDGRGGDSRFLPVHEGRLDLGNWFVVSAFKPAAAE